MLQVRPSRVADHCTYFLSSEIITIIIRIKKKAHFTGASISSAAKKPFPNSFLKNALGKQDFSREKDTESARATRKRDQSHLAFLKEYEADNEVVAVKQKTSSHADVIDLISDGDSEDETSKENKPRPRYGVRMYVQRDSDNFFLLLLEHVHHYNRY